VLELRLSDGTHQQRWTTDSEARLWLPTHHHAAFVVDGYSRVISTLVNGVFGSGGEARSQGWTHLGSDRSSLTGSGDIGLVDGAGACGLHSSLRLLRVYGNYLLTTEVVGNWRHWRRTQRAQPFSSAAAGATATPQQPP